MYQHTIPQSVSLPPADSLGAYPISPDTGRFGNTMGAPFHYTYGDRSIVWWKSRDCLKTISRMSYRQYQWSIFGVSRMNRVPFMSVRLTRSVIPFYSGLWGIAVRVAIVCRRSPSCTAAETIISHVRSASVQGADRKRMMCNLWRS